MHNLLIIYLVKNDECETEKCNLKCERYIIILIYER